MSEKQRDLAVELGRKIAQILEKNGISQAELAERLKKDKGHVSRILNGELNVTLRTVAELEQALGTKILRI